MNSATFKAASWMVLLVTAMAVLSLLVCTIATNA